MKKGTNRPVSPHLTIYKVQRGSFFSILTRLTGLFLLAYMLFVQALFVGWEFAGVSYNYFYLFSRFYSLNQDYLFISTFVVLSLSMALTYHVLLSARLYYWLMFGDSFLHTLRLSKNNYQRSAFLMLSLAGPIMSYYVLIRFFDPLCVVPSYELTPDQIWYMKQLLISSKKSI